MKPEAEIPEGEYVFNDLCHVWGVEEACSLELPKKLSEKGLPNPYDSKWRWGKVEISKLSVPEVESSKEVSYLKERGTYPPEILVYKGEVINGAGWVRALSTLGEKEVFAWVCESEEEEDVRKYTVDEAIKNLVAVEGHISSFEQGGDALFCIDCMRKHLYYLWLLADEGKTFLPEHMETWQKLSNWCKYYIENLTGKESLTLEVARKMKQQERMIRKELDHIRRSL